MKQANDSEGVVIRSYSSWAKANDQKCRTFAGYEGNHRMFRVTDRPTILQRAGFRLLGGVDRSRDYPTPRSAVVKMISEWAGPLSVVLYYGSVEGEVIVWGK